jgi:hypothetical protein
MVGEVKLLDPEDRTARRGHELLSRNAGELVVLREIPPACIGGEGLRELELVYRLIDSPETICNQRILIRALHQKSNPKLFGMLTPSSPV